MEDFKTLRLLDKIQFVFRKIGVDYPVMRQILQVKLLMDERKVPTFYNQSAKKKDKDQKYGYIKSLWIYVLIGLILIPFMGFGENYLFSMSIAYAIIIFMIMTTLISEFSSVLLDVRDRTILSTKPISDKTVNAAKFMHILIYLSYLTIAITGIPVIVSFINQGILFGVITIVEILLINVFVVVLTAMFYIVILRFFDGEKLKDLINYVQIGLTLAMMIGYQFLVRSFELVDLNITFEFQWWSIFLIPMWFAAPYELLLNGNWSLLPILFSILSVVVPFVSIWLYIKLIPTFERNLQKLLSTSKSKKEKKNRLKDFLLSLICYTNDERAFYRFASLMMKQEREFKLKVYPSLGFAFVIPFIFIINNARFEDIDYSVSMGYLNIYFSMLIIPTSVLMLGHASNYKAAWIYQIFPIKDLGSLQKGSLKAFLIKLFIPVYLVLSVVFCFIYGTRIVPDLLVVLVTSWIFTCICYIGYGRKIPFTQPFNEIGDSQGWKSLVLMIPVAILAGIHYFMVSQFTYGAIIYLFVLVILNVIVWKIVFGKGKQ